MFDRIGKRSAAQRALRLVSLVVACVLVQPAAALAATVWDVDKLVKENTLAGPGHPLTLQDGSVTGVVRVDYLRTLLEAHKRLSEVSRVNVSLALVIDKRPQATAYFGERQIIVTTGMLDIVGADRNMAAALLGHEYAHLSLRHAVQRVQNLPNIVRGAVVAAGEVSQRTGDEAAAARAGGMTVKLLAASFSRQQEAEADRVGTEFLSSAGYDPKGVILLMNAFLKITGGGATGYLDTHPGFEERLTRAAPTVVNTQNDATAATLVKQKNWKSLSHLVEPWLKTNPDSARGWYYKGMALRGLRQPGALPAFEKAVAFDPNFSKGWLALCVELYRADRQRDSLTCSEHIPRGDLHDEYIAKTFQHPVYVGGLSGPGGMSEWEAQVIRAVLKPRGQAALPAR